MIALLDSTICQFHFPVELTEPFEHEQPAECPNCGSRYRITSINPIWYVRDIDCQVRLSSLENRQISDKQQQELDQQAQQVDEMRILAIVQRTLDTLLSGNQEFS
jgi:hypothetical protein